MRLFDPALNTGRLVYEVLRQIDAKAFDWKTRVEIPAADQSLDDRIPRRASVRRLAKRMIKQSHNTSTDALFKLVGLAAPSQTLDVWGLAGMRIVMPTRKFWLSLAGGRSICRSTAPLATSTRRRLERLEGGYYYKWDKRSVDNRHPAHATDIQGGGVPSFMPAPACSVASSGPAVYRRRRPERTVLYRVVQENLETWLAERQADDAEAGGVPRWVEGELRRYLACGILAHGFGRTRCAQCGYDFVVAFSCRGRGLCPSCNAREDT